jgi:hypothetical protein
LEELKVDLDEKKLRRYKSDWLRHVTRMNNRVPKIVLNYRPNGRRRIERTFNETARRGRNSSVKVYQLVTGDDDDDDDDDDDMIYSTLCFCNFFLWLNDITLNAPGGTEKHKS